jgi:hypothetical protein
MTATTGIRVIAGAMLTDDPGRIGGRPMILPIKGPNAVRASIVEPAPTGGRVLIAAAKVATTVIEHSQ